MQTTSSKVLVVDDEPINIDLMEAVLVPEGFHVESAEDGAMALEMIPNTLPDVILLDVMMPGLDGYQVCAKIRENTALPYIPIIFVTAKHTTMSDMIQGFDAGGDDYVKKPFEPPELLSRMRAALRLKASLDRLARTKKELSRYVSLSTMEMVDNFASGESINPGESRDLTVLFSDIRGFTSISENADPKKVFEILNVYLSEQIDIIEGHHGVIDKLSGDEIMAVFEGPEMVDNALSCGKSIVDALKEKDQRLEEEWIGVGIGVNTGPVYVGAIGSETYKDYTVVGNTVNLAARLCGYAKKYQVVFSEYTMNTIREKTLTYQFEGEVSFKGLSRPIEVFKLL
jgi:class 3 adenylate cyclase